MPEPTLDFVDVMPEAEHNATVIWLHGLGDSGNGFAPLVPELKLPKEAGIRFIFPHAPVQPITINNGMPMRAWYDIRSLSIEQRADVDGVIESAESVRRLIDNEIENGIKPERIILAGFSQGGVIAYHLGLRYPKTLAGILTLSTYMSEPNTLEEQGSIENKQTPIFVCHGQQDEVVQASLGRMAYDALVKAGYDATWKDYPMQHNVCAEEINDISQWIQQRLVK
jgi:phospholipase/carboxylesterase